MRHSVANVDLSSLLNLSAFKLTYVATEGMLLASLAEGLVSALFSLSSNVNIKVLMGRP